MLERENMELFYDSHDNWCTATFLNRIIARFRDRSLIATFFPLHRKPVDTVDWQVAKKIGSLSFYTKMSRQWLISSLKLKGLYRWNFLIINTELKRKDGNLMYSRSLEDCNAEFFCQLSFSNQEVKWPTAHGPAVTWLTSHVTPVRS